jgi:hypothetical protein
MAIIVIVLLTFTLAALEVFLSGDESRGGLVSGLELGNGKGNVRVLAAANLILMVARSRLLWGCGA